MKEKNLLKIQKILTNLYFLITIIIFVFTLGFMTNIYKLFYDGNIETLNYYKSIQPLNKALFNKAVIFLIFSVLHALFQYRKHLVGLLGILLALISTIYSIIYSIIFVIELADFKKQYNNLDVSFMEDYTQSTFIFDFGSIIYIILLFISLVLLGSIITGAMYKLNSVKEV